MLNVTPLKGSSSSCSKYYCAMVAYYANGNIIQPRFEGKAAKMLGIEGTFTQKMFQSLLDGQLPDDTQMHTRMVNGKPTRRMGTELTFAAPKSVSLLALVDSRVLEAFQETVKESMAHIEANYAQARKTQDGKTVYQKTQNLCYATFFEHDSRAGEPHLHAHVPVFNFTQMDGAWRALASSNQRYTADSVDVEGYNEQLMASKKIEGQFVRALLAYKLRQLGYQLDLKPQGLFEIKGVPTTLLEAYSSRQKAIEAAMKEAGVTGAKKAALFQEVTRDAKRSKSSKDLLATLSEEDLKTLNQVAHHSTRPITHAPSHVETAKRAIRLGIESLSEKQTGFKLSRLRGEASLFLMGQWHPKVLGEALEAMVASGEIIALDKLRGDFRLTTKKLLEQEEKRSKTVSNYKVNGDALRSHEALSSSLDSMLDSLKSQSDKGVMLLDVPDRKLRCQLLREIELSEKGTPIWLSTSMQGAKNIERFTGKEPFEWHLSLKSQLRRFFRGSIRAQTVQHFLDQQSPASGIILVEEAHKLSFKQFDTLFEKAKERHVRLVLAGDLHKASWGTSAFKSLMQTDAGKLKIRAPLLKDRSAAQKALYYLDGNKALKAQRILRPLIYGGQDFEEQAIEALCDLADPCKGGVLTINDGKALSRLNDQVRFRLKSRGHIAKEETVMSVLESVYPTQTQKRLCKTYKDISCVRIFSKTPDMPGGFFQLDRIDEEKGILHLTPMQKKNRQSVQLAIKAIEKRGLDLRLYKKGVRLVSVGDRLRWHTQFKNTGLLSNHAYRVTGITKEALTLESHRGERIRALRGSVESQCFEMDWVRPTYCLQGSSGAEIIIALKGRDTRLYLDVLLKLLSEVGSSSLAIFTEDKNIFEKEAFKLAPLQKKWEANQQALQKTLLQAVRPAVDFCEKSAQQIVDESIGMLWETEVAVSPKALLKTVLTRTMGHAPPQSVMARLDTLLEGKAFEGFFRRVNLPDSPNYAQLKVHAVPTPKSLGEYKKSESNQEVGIFALNVEGVSASKLAKGIRADYQAMGKWLDIQVKEDRCLLVVHGTWPVSQVRSLFPKESVSLWGLKSQKELEEALLHELKESSSPIKEGLKLESGASVDHKHVFEKMISEEKNVQVLQGRAGVGKTWFWGASHRALKGVSLTGFAPTHMAVGELRARGIPSTTLASFLGQEKSVHAPFVVLDESSMIGTESMHTFLKQTRGLKRVLTGDVHQFAPIGWGNPFRLVQEEGDIPVHDMRHIQRQKTALLKKVVHQLYANQPVSALKHLESHASLLETPSDQKEGEILTPDALMARRAEGIAKVFASWDIEKRNRTLVMAPLNAQRKLLNHKMREALFGEALSHGFETFQWEARHLKASERHDAGSYRKSDYLRFSRGGFGSSEVYFEVMGADTHTNTLHLRSKAEQIELKLSDLDPSCSPEVYRKESIQLIQSERIVFKRSNRQAGYMASTYAEVIAPIGEGQLLIQPCKGAGDHWKPSGGQRVLDLRNPATHHFDYAYAMTLHNAQGVTGDGALLWMPSHSQLNNLTSLLIGISRARYQVKVFADDLKTTFQKIHQAQTSFDKAHAHALKAIGISLKEDLRGQRFGASEPHLPASQTKAPLSKERSASSYIDPQTINHIRTALDTQAESIVKQLGHALGELKQKGDQIRIGSNKGSMVVNLKEGCWFDFQTGKGGRMFEFVKMTSGLTRGEDFKKLCAYSAQLAGVPLEGHKAPSHQTMPVYAQKKTINEKGLDSDQQKKIEKARSIASCARPISGTLAERYLKEHRGIELDHAPASIRFHPALYSALNKKAMPAMVAIATNGEGKVQAIQATFLDPNTANKAHGVHVSKQTWGVLKGASVTLSKAGHDYVHSAIAEGTETGLSAMVACPQTHVEVSLGKSNMRHIHPSKLAKTVTLLEDHDEDDGRGRVEIGRIADRLKGLGKRVLLAKPHTVGHDFNDVLRRHGVSEVKRLILDEHASFEEGQHMEEERHEMAQSQIRQRQMVSRMRMSI